MSCCAYSSRTPSVLSFSKEKIFVYQTGSDANKCGEINILNLENGVINTISAKDGEYITSACFNVEDRFKYIRFDVIDENGRHANTRAYFSDEWK